MKKILQVFCLVVVMMMTNVSFALDVASNSSVIEMIEFQDGEADTIYDSSSPNPFASSNEKITSIQPARPNYLGLVRGIFYLGCVLAIVLVPIVIAIVFIVKRKNKKK